jgi:hypothetical protein
VVSGPGLNCLTSNAGISRPRRRNCGASTPPSIKLSTPNGTWRDSRPKRACRSLSIDDFVPYSKVLHALTADFVRAVPEDKRDFTPDAPGRSGRALPPHRIGDGFAPFCKQLRHVVCVRGVYTAALATRKVDWTRKHEHYVGPLSREALLAVLDDKQRHLLATLETVDMDAPIDWDRTPFTFALFTWHQFGERSPALAGNHRITFVATMARSNLAAPNTSVSMRQ